MGLQALHSDASRLLSFLAATLFSTNVLCASGIEESMADRKHAAPSMRCSKMQHHASQQCMYPASKRLNYNTHDQGVAERQSRHWLMQYNHTSHIL